MPPSPPKETTAAFPLTATTTLNPPPSPESRRTLRRLQSAQNLSTRAAHQPSLISQQRLQLQSQQRATSPTKRNVSISNRSPQRGRANSDATALGPLATLPTRRVGLNKRSLAADGLSLERLIRDGPVDGDIDGSLESARTKILDLGIKSDGDGMSSLRIYAWLLLLNAPIMETESYLSYIYRGASPAYSKIRNDTFRTLTTDPLFRRRVSEASLIRLLNAVAWKLQDTKAEREQDQPAPGLPAVRHSLPVDAQPSRPRTSMPSMGMGMGAGPGPGAEPDSSPLSKSRARTLTITTEGSESSTLGPGAGLYVQGMNVLAAPFLYAARSESEAFVALYQLITVECPGYVRGAMSGVHKGLKLMDKVLAICDPKLSLFLVSKGLFAELYAFPSVLTLCACTPPLPEVMRLWDFLFAYGPHLNILCIVAQLVIVRSEIMSSPNPNKLLRSFPALNAEQIKRTTLAIINMIPDDIYEEIVVHAR